MDYEQETGTPLPAVEENTLYVPPQIATHPKTGIFVGRFGLRAGWGIAIYVLLFAILIALITFVALAATGHLKEAMSKATNTHAATASKTAATAAPKPREETKPEGSAINEALLFAALGLAAWVLSRMERRRLGVYGIGQARWRDVFPGAFWGLASLSLLVGVLRAGHFLVFDARLLAGSAIVLYGAKWLLVFFFVGLFEEYLFRGYLQYTLMRGVFGLAERISATHARAIAFWIAAVLLSLLFLLAHGKNPGETALGLFSVFLAGMVFTYALWRTGSLWWAIGFHMAWDWAQSFLFGVPDSGGLSAGRLFQTHPVGNPLLSGGTVGPEGSAFLVPCVLVVALIIRFTTRPGTQPALEQGTLHTAAPHEGVPVLP